MQAEEADFEVSAVELSGLASKTVRKRVNAVGRAAPPEHPLFNGAYELRVRRADAKVLSLLWEGGENFSGVHPVYSFHSASFELRYRADERQQLGETRR